MDFTQMEKDACGIGAVVRLDGRPTHTVVDQALHIVEKLEHRAGKDAAGEVGDGVGIMTQIPHAFLQKELDLPQAGEYGVGMFFFPADRLENEQARRLFETIVRKEGCGFLGWRQVPVDADILGRKALACMPSIWQGFVEKPKNLSEKAFERKLYVIRREFEKSSPQTYVCSLSAKTIVYKGMFLVDQLRRFYKDLQDEKYESAIGLVHSRFSTNTTPSWQRAHPNRMICHNGEINTIRGNANRMLAREETMSSPLLDEEYSKILPVISIAGSDSAMLDNTLEFLVMNGMDLAKAVMLTIPEPWKHVPMSQSRQDFYHYHATMMEPWDGPAAILFSDGDIAGAVLDRNGLRPARWCQLDDGTVILSSEVGVLDLDPERVVKKSRLEPGKMLVIDTKAHEIKTDAELKEGYAQAQPYGEWLHMNLLHLEDLPAPDRKTRMHTQEQRDKLYKVFGYTYEDMKEQILPMAKEGKEPTASMGTDIPLAVLSRLHPSLFHYFKQLFAQVTNPPIDSLREEVVTDTTVYMGSDGNLLQETAKNCSVLEVNNPILDARDMDKIRSLDRPGFRAETLSLLFYRGMPLEDAIAQLYLQCDKAIRDGANLLILSDRGIDEARMAIPSLLAVSALEQHLVNTKKKTSVSLIVESGEPRTVHEFACLLGYGASAVYPYLAHECIEELISLDILDKEPSKAIEDYNHAVLHGIVKIAAKMGISTLQSYQGAQIFEAIGIDKGVIDRYFTNTVSRIGGIGMEDIEKDLVFHHDHAFDPLGLGVDTTLESNGFHRLRSGPGKEDHLYDPKTIVLLQQACQQGDYDLFKEYTARVDDEKRPHTIRSQFEIRSGKEPIDIREVEPVSEIVKRFKTGAMSYGSISQEAHETMAIAMNRLGGKSNSGEGGERPERFGTEKNSAIKQVASGRFGVTCDYLVSAKEIQIKMAQGAKPGEGGHLPGGKVYPWIAKTRYSTPGVSLISPPPHHDIYSIEDLAQLIYDLKNANRDARISVKLVSENSVGTIACGVAKAGAKVILISGYDGGTGAAPQSSIHHAGLPWELGLAETHKTLVENGLRSRVIVETDGKLMSGRDIAVAALLGAEEFGFATAPLVTMGCAMMRVCNQDTCPFGVATQNAELRKRFKGTPEAVMHFMCFMAEELREIMAENGFRTVDEMVGHSECLKVKENSSLRLEELIQDPVPAHCVDADEYDFQLENTLDLAVLVPGFKKYMKKEPKPHTVQVMVESTDRAAGTLLGSEITKQYGSSLADDTFTVKCFGGAGQSFGAFIPKGLTMRLEGDANDGFGKGLSGGRLAVYPSQKAKFKAEDNVIIGNVALYGATGGEAYIRGKAGERFCVRNSGAVAVAEGCGDHGLEYMTGGTVAILGPAGKNFAAGMSGGIAYVLDRDHTLYTRLNGELVQMEEVTEKPDREMLQKMLQDHYQMTGSTVAQELLEDFEASLKDFKKIIPNDFKQIRNAIKAFEDSGFPAEEAELLAFEELSKKKGA